MSKLNMPGFNAHASLYSPGKHYRPAGSEPQGQGHSLVPQLGGKGFKGFNGCINDCLDSHSGWTREQCARSCRDPGHAGTSSDSSFNDFLSSTGIDFWEAGCSAMLNPLLCAKVGDVMRRQS